MARKYRFSWNAFDDGTVAALVREIGPSNCGTDNSRAWLARAVPRPNQDFVRQVKRTLEQTWLPIYPGLSNIVQHLMDAGVGPMSSSPQTSREYVHYIRRCRNTTTVQRCLLEAMLRYGDQDGASGELAFEDRIPRFAILEPAKQPQDHRKPYDYQETAWNKLSAHLAESQGTGVFQGLLIMPTGSGKTFTVARWLTDNVVNRGGRVIWLAHRHELLEQAAREFHSLAGFARNQNSIRVRIVSGIHCATTQIDPSDQVLIASVSSLARRQDLLQSFLEDPKTFLVIDEAHHAVAKSYRDIINTLNLCPQQCILGLTATPTRTAGKERGTLSALFGNKILFDVPIKDLIERQFLARPIPIQVATKADVEAGVTVEDKTHLARFHDLGEAWLDRIAHIEQRNALIVHHYLENRQKYGKTLIFAINVAHAALLAERFQEKGVKADYIASYRLGHESTKNYDVIHRFRDETEEDALDVLINVQILTEGVDIPNIQTVFLTRPTVSEILLRQMIGRALRGPKAGGTKDAYIVSFEDHWEQFREWLSPIELIEGLISDPPDPVNPRKKVLDFLPWDLIREFASTIAKQGRGFEADVFEAIPHGWFILSRDQDGEDVYQTVAVYEHQLPCWKALLEHLWSLPEEAQSTLKFDETLDEFFFDCDHPWPAQHDVLKVIEHWKAGGDQPEYNFLKERAECDPFRIADQIHQKNLTASAKRDLIKSRYSELAKAIYPSLREFQAAVDDALFELENPEEANKHRRAVPIFTPGPTDYLASGPHYDLKRLADSVIAVAPKYLGLSTLPSLNFSVQWTRRLVKGWYAQAYWMPGQDFGSGSIRVNRLLDSPDVPEEVIQFLLWHEYVHLYLQQGHTATFRMLERKWPTYREADRFLDNLNEKFVVQFW